ncbi:MAG: hypothetical protein HYV39_04040 [Candidatus Levybacteria bacterium]|nr:hypothetical protein [Candidatus Levybacteria bacterium]
MKRFFHHFFLPHESNNHRPKLLHHKTIVFFIAFFLIGQILLEKAKTDFSDVLGATADISVEKLLLLTNRERQSKGLGQLVLNEQLSKAAFLKGTNMLEKNYWAHNAPDGTTPWHFIKQTEYNYVYAGENLARGFTHSEDIVDAWMTSPTHRDNMFSPNYQDIGFAVLEGKLVGENTTLVVEMFGSAQPLQLAKTPETVLQPVSPQLAGERSLSSEIAPSYLKNQPIINSISLSWYIGIGTITLFIFILSIDMIIIERRKIIRFVGHNIDHVVFLGLVLLFIILVNHGYIL